MDKRVKSGFERGSSGGGLQGQDFRLVDLSHTIENGLVTYKGLPAPVICDYLSREDSRRLYAPGTEFQIGKIEMVANTGTYIDCPFHRYADGEDLSEVSLERLAELPGVKIDAPYTGSLAVTADQLRARKSDGRPRQRGADGPTERGAIGPTERGADGPMRGHAVLIHTGWAAHWNTEHYYTNHPYLTEEAAVYLRDCGVRLVGIDSHNIDDTRGNTRPVHSTLLGAGILIVEHLCHLEALPAEGFVFSAIPPKFKGVGTFPVRAMAKLKK
jgi:arylformamidase